MSRTATDAAVETPTAKARSGGRPQARKLAPYGFVSPTVILMFVLMLVPIVMVIGYSFMDNVIMNKNPKFVGFDNYVEILTDAVFHTALANTLVFTVVSVAAHLVLGLAFAMLLNTPLLGTSDQGPVPGRLRPAVAVHRGDHRRPVAAAAGPERRHQLPAAERRDHRLTGSSGSPRPAPRCSRSRSSTSGPATRSTWSACWPGCRASPRTSTRPPRSTGPTAAAVLQRHAPAAQADHHQHGACSTSSGHRSSSR